ncbi:hypothetical protein [Microbacterium esteraromaticum]|uniref:hypothetical protein n=1 Tax=Microbacterium esteraromaticum TaxID=57043 RepID=UPI00195892DB|nr:hypothetical protein [Microbacterium esteraromaticum]MBM7466107.1 hypothetical protein [Microbacterium esteraromaticum]
MVIIAMIGILLIIGGIGVIIARGTLGSNITHAGLAFPPTASPSVMAATLGAGQFLLGVLLVALSYLLPRRLGIVSIDAIFVGVAGVLRQWTIPLALVALAVAGAGMVLGVRAVVHIWERRSAWSEDGGDMHIPGRERRGILANTLLTASSGVGFAVGLLTFVSGRNWAL